MCPPQLAQAKVEEEEKSWFSWGGGGESNKEPEKSPREPAVTRDKGGKVTLKALPTDLGTGPPTNTRPPGWRTDCCVAPAMPGRTGISENASEADKERAQVSMVQVCKLSGSLWADSGHVRGAIDLHIPCRVPRPDIADIQRREAPVVPWGISLIS